MAEVGTYEVDSGVFVRIEFEPAGDFVPAGTDEILGRVREAVEPAVAAAQVVVDRARALSPDEVEVKFGIKVSGQANWWIAKAATDANFEITLTWKPATGTS